MSIILVTGGSGLVGSAIKHVIETEPVGSRYGKKHGETWIFASSKDGDLKFVSRLELRMQTETGIETRQPPRYYSTSTSRHMLFISPHWVSSVVLMLVAHMR